MTKKERNYLFYLEDMYESMLRIQEYINNLSFAEFRENHLVTDAVLRYLEIIGEASKNVPFPLNKNILNSHGNKCMGCGILLFMSTLELILKTSGRLFPMNCPKISKTWNHLFNPKNSNR